MKKLLIIIITIFINIQIQAQVISWAVQPGVYTKIEPCWSDMYLVYKGDNVGVIRYDGTVIVKPEATRITGFYEGFALVLKSEGGHEIILGILSKDGSYIKVDGTYYTIPYQEFFSEGLLTITTSRGQAGYMNENGVIVKTFDVPFVAPFSEGYAVVGENEDYTLIDKRFNALTIQLGTVSQIYGGSNVYKGFAIVMDGNGKYYNYDVNRGICKRISEPKSLDYDYMYCFTSMTDRSDNVPYEPIQRSSVTLPVIKDGDKYGYANEGNIILPYQFEQAENFYGKSAIVKTNGKYALLSIHYTNDNLEIKPDSIIKYRKSSRKDITHKFGLYLPEMLQQNNVNVKVKDENGMYMSLSNNGNSYEFKTNGGIGTKQYNVEIEGDGLILWKGDIAYNYTIEADPVIIHEEKEIGRYQPLKVSLKASNTQADKNNRCYVNATITNPNPDAITATVSMTGSNLLEAVSQRITIPAYGSKDVSTYFTVKKATSGQKVTVSTTAGGSATLDGLQLIPF